MCGSTAPVDHTSMGCYNYAVKNTNPVYNDKEYWDILYKPKTCWE